MLEEKWELKVPSEDVDGEPFSVPFSYYVKSKVIDPTSGSTRDQHVWTTDFLSFEDFLIKYLRFLFFPIMSIFYRKLYIFSFYLTFKISFCIFIIIFFFEEM